MMDTTIFELRNPSENIGFISFEIPILPAYAIHHSELQMTGAFGAATSLSNHQIEQEYVIIPRGIAMMAEDLNGSQNGILTIHHAGIKDYQLLFPHVKDLSLRKRLGQLAEEADMALRSGGWMAYLVMVGGTIEGLLFNIFPKISNFQKLLLKASEVSIISPDEKELLDKVRHMRNQIHANRHDQDFADRSIALDLSIIYQRMLKMNWEAKELKYLIDQFL